MLQLKLNYCACQPVEWNNYFVAPRNAVAPAGERATSDKIPGTSTSSAIGLPPPMDGATSKHEGAKCATRGFLLHYAQRTMNVATLASYSSSSYQHLRRSRSLDLIVFP